MADVTVFATATGYADWGDVVQDGDVLVATSTLLVIENSDLTETHYIGTGFTYDAMGNVTGGTMNTMEHRTAGGGTLLGQSLGHNHSMVTGANLLATDVDAFMAYIWNGNDTFTILESDNVQVGGYTGNDRIDGGVGNDTLWGDDGDDVLNGGAGNDTIHMGNYSSAYFWDTMIGSTGNDTIDFDNGKGDFLLDYSSLATAINANLNTLTVNKGVSGTDTLAHFNNIDFQNAGIQLYGTTGNDTFVGSSNTGTWQSFRGLGGDNTITGSGGQVRLDYRSAPAGVTVNMATGIATDNGYGGTDTISGIWEIRGSDHADNLTGDANDNSFIGRAGNDYIDGGDGFDRMRYDRSGVGAVNVDLNAGVASDGLGGTDTLISIEWVRGSRTGNDTIIGRDGVDERLEGRGGNDTLRGQGGNDRLEGGDGNDILDATPVTSGANYYDNYLKPGEGNDTITGSGGSFLTYSDLSSAVTVNLSAGTATATGKSDTISGVASIRGTAFADTLIGGNSSNDNWEGYQSGAGNDILDGGSGYDELMYTWDYQYGGNLGVTVNFATGTATDPFGDTDIISNMEAVRGTRQADNITGSDNYSESYKGLAGNDSINAGKGFDSLDYSQDYRYQDISGAYGTAGVTVNLATGIATDGYGDTDTFTGITHIRGTSQADNLTGGGNDLFESFEGKAGNDIIDGGSGFDRVFYRGNTGVTVNFATGIATDEYGDTDTLSNIEYVNATDGVDYLTGGNIANDDLEVFAGRGGNDVIDGGSGFDRSIYTYDHYSGGTSGILATLTGGGAGTVVDAFGDTDTLTGIESIYGSVFADTINGSADDEQLDGAAGDDTINGGGGYDLTSYLWDELHESATDGDFGNAGVTVNLTTGIATDPYGDTDTLSGIEAVEGTRQADSLIGNAADNAFVGHAGNDMFDGRGGNDMVSYSIDDDSAMFGLLSPLETPIVGGVTVNLATGVATDSFGDTDTLTSIEGVEGTNRSDVLTGNDADNMLDGLAGADILSGGNGNDVLEGGAGADTLNGGAGRDTVSYEMSPGAVVVRLYNGTGSVNDAHGDTLTSVENVVGSFFDDSLIGAYGVNNVLEGGAGADYINGLTGTNTAAYSSSAAGVIVRLYNGTGSGGDATGDTLVNIQNAVGSAHNDSLIGAYGVNNTLEGRAGADYINGLSGCNAVSYASSSASVTVRLYNGTGSGGDATGDTLVNIQNAVGSVHNDTLVGSFGASNFLSGGLGSDYLFGLSGNDVIYGGWGDDLLAGGSGADVLNGGLGSDTTTYYSSSAAVIVRLYNGTGSGGEATGDTYSGIENAIGTSFNDVLIGSYGVDNILEGGAGADYINGLSGNDTVSYASSSGGVTVNLDSGAASGSDANGDSLHDIENIIGSGYVDTLLGANGVDNILEGGAGADNLNGLTGNNTVSYAGSTTGVTVRLYNSTATGGDATGDTLANFDNVIGSMSNDLLLGSYGTDNVITGGRGGDHMFGLTGNDTFVFDDGFGHDVIHDFDNGTEMMDMRGSSLSAADLRIEVVGSDTLVHFDQQDADITDTITLSGITSGIDASDFIF